MPQTLTLDQTFPLAGAYDALTCPMPDRVREGRSQRRAFPYSERHVQCVWYDSRLRPSEHLCHMRSHLDCGLDQSGHVQELTNPQERKRKDIWWVDSDGTNAEEVAGDIAKSFSEQAPPWFARASDLESALELVEAMHDCLAKFTRAALLARHLGHQELWRKYDDLAEAEALRIGASTDRGDWYGI